MLRNYGITVGLLLALSTVLLAQPISRSEVKPGLVLTIRDAGPMPFQVTRLEPSVALTLAPGEAAHPRSSGGDEFRWQGTINLLLPGKYRFDAVLLGELTVKIGTTEVFQARVTEGMISTAKTVRGREVDLTPGIQPFEAIFRRTGPSARVDLHWTGPGFQLEPIPYFFFGHLRDQRPASFASMVAEEHGRFLVEELSCLRCHPAAATDMQAKTLVERSGPNLSQIGQRVYPGWLEAWLANPQKLRPNSMMPKLFTDDAKGAAERYAVVQFLQSLGGPIQPTPPIAEKQLQRSITQGRVLFLTSGCAACHGDKLTGPPSQPVKTDLDADDGPVFEPSDYLYSLGTSSPTGYYRLGHLGSKYPAEALAKFLKNPLTTHPLGRMPNLGLSDIDASNLAYFLVRYVDESLPRDCSPEPKINPMDLAAVVFAQLKLPQDEQAKFAELPRAEQWKQLGQGLFQSRGCVNCHEVEVAGKRLPRHAAKSWELLQQQPVAGCLAENPATGTVPVYPLTSEQKSAITTFLRQGTTGPGSPAPGYEARRALKRFYCLNCHNRDGEGGIDAAIADIMKSLENAQNADDVQPPRLTGVGHKLRTPWLKEVLTAGGRARPWMSLRMPQYGAEKVGFLVEALPKSEGTVTDDAIGKAEFTAAKIEAGRDLAGKTGFGCIACHDISGMRGGGTRGPDLATTNQRVRYDWYVRWMNQPQRLAPRTRMPQHFINGRSQIDRHFGGDAEAQIEALWAYFSLGPGLPLPAGMEPPKGIVQTVKDRPEVLRTFMPDAAGTKPIAVGYPGGIHLVFDAAQARLAYAWMGNFLDLTPVWTNRGGQPATLLGTKFWTPPPGHPWAITSNRTPPDFARQADDPAYGKQLPNDELYAGPRYVQFGGYRLDSQGFPTFHYELTSEDRKHRLLVADKPSPLPVSVASGLQRTFSIRSPGGGNTVWFLAGSTSGEPRVYGPSGTRLPLQLNSPDPEVPAVGSRVILPNAAGAIMIRVASGPNDLAWQFVKPAKDGNWQALLRFPQADKQTDIEVTLHLWWLPRDDEMLIRSFADK